jgi:N-acetylmuramate 1-kinase
MLNRQSQFETWLMQQCESSAISLQALAKDASFRRYFGLSHDTQWLAVDAPPEHEKNHEFVAVAEAFSKIGVRVPVIKAYDLERGFLLVENLGPDSYLKVLQAEPHFADRLYKEAMDALVNIASSPLGGLESFDRVYLQTELNHFTDWFLEQYLGCSLSAADKQMLQNAYDFLMRRASEQKQVCIHRDYHSRNLIVREQDNPGVIDFQDAMLGPLTYDLVSLLRDAYIAWPREQVESWARYFYDTYSAKHPDFHRSWPEFLDDFNLMGVQRNLKAIFIFARKWLRDEDAGYLNDIPRTLDYVLTVSKDYPELRVFRSFLHEQVQPKLEALA